jgi:hypothetical protein
MSYEVQSVRSFHAESIKRYYIQRVADIVRRWTRQETPKIESMDRLNNETFLNFVSIKSFKTCSRFSEALLDPTLKAGPFQEQKHIT